MSLLRRGTETVSVFPEAATVDTDGNEAATVDTDGNPVTRPGTVGIVCRAVVQPLSSTEGDEGTESKYRLRLVGYPDLLGAQSAVEWRGRRYAILGDALVYNGSPRTARAEYVMVRK